MSEWRYKPEEKLSECLPRMLARGRIPPGLSDAHEREPQQGIARDRLGRGLRYRRDPGGLQGGRAEGGGKDARGGGGKELLGLHERECH